MFLFSLGSVGIKLVRRERVVVSSSKHFWSKGEIKGGVAFTNISCLCKESLHQEQNVWVSEERTCCTKREAEFHPQDPHEKNGTQCPSAGETEKSGSPGAHWTAKANYLKNPAAWLPRNDTQVLQTHTYTRTHAQPVLAIKPEDLCSIPKTHMLEGKNWLLWLLLWPPCTWCGTHVHTCTKIINT